MKNYLCKIIKKLTFVSITYKVYRINLTSLILTSKSNHYVEGRSFDSLAHPSPKPKRAVRDGEIPHHTLLRLVRAMEWGKSFEFIITRTMEKASSGGTVLNKRWTTT